MSLTRKMQRKMFVRSLLLQAALDYKHMQGVGFAFGLSPWLRRLYPHAEDRARALRRHLEFFNTQPYMAGIALGVAAQQEEAAAADPSASRDARTAQMKKTVGSCLAAVGDPLFWGAWRPLCATLGAAAILLSPRGGPLGMIVAGSLILYNVPVWLWRWKGIRWGYEDGERVVARLSGMKLQRRLKQLRWAGFALAALGAAAFLLRPGPEAFDASPLGVPGSLGVLGAGWLMKRAGWSGLKAYGALLALGLGAAWIFS